MCVKHVQCTNFVSVGITPVSKDLLKMRHNIGEILGASSLTKNCFSSSGPADFYEARFDSNFEIP